MTCTAAAMCSWNAQPGQSSSKRLSCVEGCGNPHVAAHTLSPLERFFRFRSSAFFDPPPAPMLGAGSADAIACSAALRVGSYALALAARLQGERSNCCVLRLALQRSQRQRAKCALHCTEQLGVAWTTSSCCRHVRWARSPCCAEPR